ncbi:hypothetical protein F3N42_03815 [Marinihelvus fidelis]|uniref:Uncharacterized protein n=1 Tax=Marinihelvus fidelis TaxID=2613842 RepID=A0A5N0TG87_9GAMM|nr:hypothetical protein [Marinihelvus fidelis]KAA9133488.1 hypothetical protein F3N42_03815 [Marinihelvus fidelis]
MSRHRWSGRSIIGKGASLKSIHKCTRCGWERWIHAPMKGIEYTQYRRGEATLGGSGVDPQEPECAGN